MMHCGIYANFLKLERLKDHIISKIAGYFFKLKISEFR